MVYNAFRLRGTYVDCFFKLWKRFVNISRRGKKSLQFRVQSLQLWLSVGCAPTDFVFLFKNAAFRRTAESFSSCKLITHSSKLARSAPRAGFLPTPPLARRAERSEGEAWAAGERGLSFEFTVYSLQLWLSVGCAPTDFVFYLKTRLFAKKRKASAVVN